MIAEVGLHHRRKRRQRHADTEVETRVGVLIVAASGAVATIVGVLLQAVDAVVGREIGGITHKTLAMVIVLLSQNHFLAPVAHNVAHEGRTSACATMSAPVRLLRELHQTALAPHGGHHQVGAIVLATGRTEFFAQQVGIPPQTFKHRRNAPLRTGFARGISLAVIDVVIGETI